MGGNTESHPKGTAASTPQRWTAAAAPRYGASTACGSSAAILSKVVIAPEPRPAPAPPSSHPPRPALSSPQRPTATTHKNTATTKTSVAGWDNCSRCSTREEAANIAYSEVKVDADAVRRVERRIEEAEEARRAAEAAATEAASEARRAHEETGCIRAEFKEMVRWREAVLQVREMLDEADCIDGRSGDSEERNDGGWC